MANSIYSLIQTGVNTGNSLNEMMEAIIRIKNNLEKDFRQHQQTFRNRKMNLSQILNNRILTLKSIEESVLNFANQKVILRKNFEKYQENRLYIKENYELINVKLKMESNFFENYFSNLRRILKGNEIVISFVKKLQKIILEEDRIPNVNIQISLNDIDDINNYKNEINNFSFVKIRYKNNEINKNDLNLMNENKLISDIINDVLVIKLDKETLNKNSFFFLDEAFVVLDSILKIPSNLTNLNNINNYDSLKERIINIFLDLINIKEKEMYIINEKIIEIEKHKKDLIGKYKILKDYYESKLLNFENSKIENILNEDHLNYILNSIKIEDDIAKQSIFSIKEDIKFYRETLNKDEKEYSYLVDSTKNFVKAINQVKQYMINNFTGLKEYLNSRKI